MAFNTKKIAEMALPRNEEAIRRASFRKENKEWLRLSQEIALSIHYYLRTSAMSQRDFAERLGVSPAYVGKLLKGGENLTIETICKIQKVIGSELISVNKPYVSSTKTARVLSVKFSDNVATSDKYKNSQTISTHGQYLTAVGTAS